MRVKTFTQFVLESRLESEIDVLRWSIKVSMIGRTEPVELDADRFDFLNSAFGEAVWAPWQDKSPEELLEITGNLGSGDESDSAEETLEYYYSQLALEISGVEVMPDCEVRLFGSFFTRSGGDAGFDALLSSEGYSLEEVVSGEELEQALREVITQLA